MRSRISILLIYLTAGLLSCSQVNEEKIKGVIFDGPAYPPITGEMLQSISESNAQWVAITPEAFTYLNDLTVKSFFSEGQWYGESIEGATIAIKEAKALGLKVFLKPHIAFTYDLSEWEGYDKEIDRKDKEALKQHRQERADYIKTLPKLSKGTWRGDFEPLTDENWKHWESQYEQFILEMAVMADSMGVDMLSIGAELNTSAMKRPLFWASLANKVRSVYKGDITFNANWYEFDEISFWNSLDLISISAYFPVSEDKVPSVKKAQKGWTESKKKIEALSNAYDLPVFFAEFGYLSSEFAGKEPWNEYIRTSPNEITQANLYEALFQSFWDEPWFKGCFVWKWYYTGNGGNGSYSPQGKKALEVLEKWYE